MQTVYLLRNARHRSDDSGHVLGVFTSIELAKSYLEVEYLEAFNQSTEWVQCPDHKGMWDCVESTFREDGDNLVTYTEDGEVADAGYAITRDVLISSFTDLVNTFLDKKDGE